jgi:NitT/TauT family transport system ATP-binding protein
MSAFIRISGLVKQFPASRGEGTLAVDRVDLDVEDGEFVSLVGPSGCGKSTILSMIAGLIQPTRGTVAIGGQVVRKPFTDLGIVFQRDLLCDWRNVLGNVLVQFEMRGVPCAPHRERARALIASVGLDGFETTYPWQLSGGMRQRVSICRALVHEPPLLLMDEPFGALDALTREQLQVDLQGIWQRSRKTVVFITHSISEAVFLSDRVAVMTPRPGRIREILSIDLPRPRSLEVRDSAEFSRYTRHIGQLFRELGVIKEGNARAI